MQYKLNNIQVPYLAYKLVREICQQYNIEYYRQVTPVSTNLIIKCNTDYYRNQTTHATIIKE